MTPIGLGDNAELVETAVFGRMVEDWLNSDIGNYLLQRAREEENAAIEQLIKGQDEAGARATIWTARKFKEWLADGITAGRQALNILEDGEQ